MTDLELLRRAQNGDRDSHHALFHKWKGAATVAAQKFIDRHPTFSEAIMRSGMSAERKLKWLYEACRDWEVQAIEEEA